MRYSGLALPRGALTRHRHWPQAWRSPQPKAAYDIIIVGGGGHGLAAAYYLAKNHGITNVAVVERGWLGGGNTGRNTTVVRSNYLYPESERLYDFSLKLYEGLSRELNYNVMLSQRGHVMLEHSRHDLESLARWANAMHMNGIEAELVTREEVGELIPALDLSPEARYPVLGGFMQRRAGTARHDAVAWGYARAADELGVDILQQCEVTGFTRGPGGSITGVDTRRGRIRAERVGIAAAGRFLRTIRQGNTVVVRVSSRDEARAEEILFRYTDHDFSFTDALSFAVMERLHITYAFAFDKHFRQFGTLDVVP